MQWMFKSGWSNDLQGTVDGDGAATLPRSLPAAGDRPAARLRRRQARGDPNKAAVCFTLFFLVSGDFKQSRRCLT